MESKYAQQVANIRNDNEDQIRILNEEDESKIEIIFHIKTTG